jgi:peroxiredoxin Q/BCP
MADLPQQGESLPDLELTTESGEHIGTGELTGKKTVLYFYPKDDTPGCTKEACAFRDRMDEYAKAGIQVYGVSLDSPGSHRKFREKYSLNFPLLTDEGGRASEALGVLREDRKRTKRVTFLLDPEGRISRIYPEVTPDSHAEEILEDAASI